MTAPPPKLWVFSTDTARVGTKNGPMSGAYIDSIVDRSSGRPTQVRIVSPVTAPCTPSSARAMCAEASQSTSCPTPTSERTASTLAIDPVGVKSAASLPRRSATRSSSAADRRVLAVDVVADLGLGHGSPHRVGRPGHGVAAEVDHSPL